MGYVRKDVQPLTFPHPLPAKVRKPLLRTVPVGASQGVGVVPGYVNTSDAPFFCCFQIPGIAVQKLSALDGQKRRGLSGFGGLADALSAGAESEDIGVFRQLPGEDLAHAFATGCQHAGGVVRAVGKKGEDLGASGKAAQTLQIQVPAVLAERAAVGGAEGNGVAVGVKKGNGRHASPPAARSLMTSPARMSPITEGTKATLPMVGRWPSVAGGAGRGCSWE